jgi:hypothetical protein
MAVAAGRWPLPVASGNGGARGKGLWELATAQNWRAGRQTRRAYSHCAKRRLRALEMVSCIKIPGAPKEPTIIRRPLLGFTTGVGEPS